MSDTDLLPGNEELEQQIAALADLAFDQTEPVVIPDLPGRSPSGPRTRAWAVPPRLALVAAVILAALAVGGFAWVVGRPATTVDPIGDSGQRQRTVADDGSGDPDSDTDSDERPVTEDAIEEGATEEGDLSSADLAWQPHLDISDPEAIDLDGLVPMSDQNQLSLLDQPIRTVAFDDLPEGWEVTGEDLNIGYHFAGRPSVSHFITLNGPGPLRATVNVDAAWEPGVVRAARSLPDEARQLTLGDSIATYHLNELSWPVDDKLSVLMFGYAESNVANTEAELVELARAITLVERTLQPVAATPEQGPSLIEEPPLLAGILAGDKWAVVADGDWLGVGYGPGLESLGAIEIGETVVSAAEELAADGTRPNHTAETATIALPGGMLWIGTISEPDATLDVFFENSQATIPTVPHGSGSAFAVPIDHRLDVIEVLVTGADGQKLMLEDLRQYGPVEFSP